MMTQLDLRRKVVQMYYYQHLSKAEICRRQNCSRPWLNRWLQRYNPDDIDTSLSDHKRGSKQANQTWSNEVRQQVLEMRCLRSQRDLWPYALIGAEAIHYELKALGNPEVPAVRTIHRWLVKAGLVEHKPAFHEKHESKPIPLPKANAVNDVQQLDLKGPIYLRGDSHKYYMVVLRDRYSRRCAMDALSSREAQGIVNFLVSSWQWLGLPRYLQLDNALEFRGSNRYPRSFGRVVRVAVNLGLEPVFNPPGEPWRNGGVERHNGFLQDRLFTIECPDLAALRQQAHTCQTACNHTHRLATLKGLTPDEVAAKAILHFPPTGYNGHQLRSLPQNKGFVSFVRLVRKSGRITLGAGDRFMVDPELAYTYVLARVDLAQKIVVISHDGTLIKTYDYSPDTVGIWANDEHGE
ncbi:MAG: helix-turn-helix domain-containing protein [Planctomycetota bacterium]